jgi:hypothetical protein
MMQITQFLMSHGGPVLFAIVFVEDCFSLRQNFVSRNVSRV